MGHVLQCKTPLKNCTQQAFTQLNPFSLAVNLQRLSDPLLTGSVLCNRAEALDVVALVMARHNKGALTELFVGSATKYVSHHCKQPLVIIHDE